MAFNPANFVKNKAKGIGERIIGDAISNAVTGLPINTISSARSTAQSLLNAGSSLETIASSVVSRTDGINRGGSIFYGFAGKDPARIAEQDLINKRRGGTKRSVYFNDINPTTKISRKRSER